MATINRENIGLLNDRISVKVNKDDYLPSFEKELKQLSRQANIQGFRKGMVPVGLMKKMHGQSVFTQEVIKSVEKELNTFLQNEKLDLFGDPIPEGNEKVSIDVNNPAEYQFDFEVGIRPEVDLSPVTDNLQLTQYKITPDEKEIDEEIDRLRKKAGERKEKDNVTSDEDILKLKFQPADAEGNITEGAEEKDEQIVAGFFAPDVRKQLRDKKKGDSFTLQLSKAFEQKELEWILKDWKKDAGTADHYYKISIEAVEEIIPRELNEDFYKEIYPAADIKSEEAFRAEIRKEHEAYWEKESRNRLDHDIFEKLVHETPVDLPEGFLKKWLRQDGEKLKSDEEVSQAYPQFEHETRWSLISGKIIRDNELDVTPEELQQNFRQRLMSYFGFSEEAGDNEKIDAFVANMMKDQKSVEETYHNLLTNKLFDWLRTKATLETKEVTQDEFIKLPHNHHHHAH
jgi:trigger factor